MEEIIAVLIPIFGMAMAFAIVYINRTASNRENLSMLEKGFTPQEIADAKNAKKENSDKLSNGFLFAGVGIGLITGSFLAKYMAIDTTVAYLAGAFLFGGLGLILAQLIKRKNA